MKSNLDLARECGATYDHQWVDEYVVAGLRFTPLQLDAFAERIRAEATPAQPEHRAVMQMALERMDRARSILTNNNPRPECNWGLLDTADLRQALKAPVQPVALPAGMPEPDAYMFQHEETGLVQFVDAQQVEWGFEENNPRLKRIDAAYTAAQVQAMHQSTARSSK